MDFKKKLKLRLFVAISYIVLGAFMILAFSIIKTENSLISGSIGIMNEIFFILFQFMLRLYGYYMWQINKISYWKNRALYMIYI